MEKENLKLSNKFKIGDYIIRHDGSKFGIVIFSDGISYSVLDDRNQKWNYIMMKNSGGGGGKG